MINQAEKSGTNTFSMIIQAANPVFIVVVVCLPIGSLIAAQVSGSFVALHYVHITTGALWTGIDLFMGFVLGPVLGSMSPKDRAGVFMRLIPRLTFMMPVLAAVASTAGFWDASRLGMLSLDNWRIDAAIFLAAVLTVQGFGLLVPNEIRIYKLLLSPTPDIEKIARLGMRNAKLGGVQGIFQLAILLVMATLRF